MQTTPVETTTSNFKVDRVVRVSASVSELSNCCRHADKDPTIAEAAAPSLLLTCGSRSFRCTSISQMRKYRFVKINMQVEAALHANGHTRLVSVVPAYLEIAVPYATRRPLLAADATNLGASRGDCT